MIYSHLETIDWNGSEIALLGKDARADEYPTNQIIFEKLPPQSTSSFKGYFKEIKKIETE